MRAPHMYVLSHVLVDEDLTVFDLQGFSMF